MQTKLSWNNLASVTTDMWHGFTRFMFPFAGTTAWVVEPVTAARGMPWSWCLEFPQYFTKECAALALLERGFHHVHLDWHNNFGCPAALREFNAFYDLLTAYGLAKRAVLIGISRGGLSAYRWAAENPAKVAVIYGDAPVCDFNSWPRKSSPAEWALLLRRYEFANEAEALAYPGNPVDSLAPLAAAGIPILHVVGDDDVVVPVAENTAIVEQRYRQLGGTIEVIHKAGVGHHPHGLEDPAPVVEFILQHTAQKGKRLMISKESHEFWVESRQSPQFGAPANPFNLAGLREGMNARQEPADKAVRCLRTQVDHIPCEWVLAPGVDPEVRVLYLHGGGYVAGSGGNYTPMAADISAAAKCAVLTVDYRLAPEYPFPAGLEDCIRAYLWMIVNAPTGPKPARATFIAGDSAGGGLTLATLLALRDRGLPLPNGGIPMSAFTDLTCASESIYGQTDKELYLHPDSLPKFVELYVSEKELRNPLASPVFGDYTGIPPLLIQAGDYEAIRDDSIRVAAKAKADGVNVTLEIWPGQVHVFQIRGLPESRQAIQRIAEFIHDRRE